MAHVSLSNNVTTAKPWSGGLESLDSMSPYLRVFDSVLTRQYASWKTKCRSGGCRFRSLQCYQRRFTRLAQPVNTFISLVWLKYNRWPFLFVPRFSSTIQLRCAVSENATYLGQLAKYARISRKLLCKYESVNSGSPKFYA